MYVLHMSIINYTLCEYSLIVVRSSWFAIYIKTKTPYFVGSFIRIFKIQIYLMTHYILKTIK